MFYNIFDKINNKKSKKQSQTIIADIHEKNSLIISELKSNKVIDLKLINLKVGDFLINNIIIERKSINDLVNSIISKRIFFQLKNMFQYKKKLLIIEGNLNELKYSNINLNVIRGFILSVILNLNIPVIFSKDYKETSSYLCLLSKNNKNKSFTLHSRIPNTINEQKKYILESFPNIGPKTSEKLINKFKTLNNIFNANETDLKQILNSKLKDFKDLLNN